MTSLVVQTSFLGDVVLTTPLIAALGSREPVDVLTTPSGAAILRNNPAVRELVVYDKRATGFAGFCRAIAAVRRRSYQRAYLAQGSFRSALIALGGGIPRRIGFTTSEGRQLYTERVEYRADLHHATRLLLLAGVDGTNSSSGTRHLPRIFPSDSDRELAAAVVRELSDPSLPYVVLAPGSAWGTKRWPYYPELAAFVADAGLNVVVTGTASELAIGDEIAAALPPGRCVNAAGRLPVLGSAAVIGEAAAIVTNDSAPQHLASAMGTPAVSIFGPTIPQFGFGPLARGSETVGRDDLPCRPCDRHGPRTCPLGHWRCMREVSPDSVLAALSRTLSQRAPA